MNLCQILLERAKELGDRLLPAFKTNSRLGGWSWVQEKSSPTPHSSGTGRLADVE